MLNQCVSKIDKCWLRLRLRLLHQSGHIHIWLIGKTNRQNNQFELKRYIARRWPRCYGVDDQGFDIRRVQIGRTLNDGTRSAWVCRFLFSVSIFLLYYIGKCIISLVFSSGQIVCVFFMFLTGQFVGPPNMFRSPKIVRHNCLNDKSYFT